eukprot:4070475-Amphidinium_carterae.1
MRAHTLEDMQDLEGFQRRSARHSGGTSPLRGSPQHLAESQLARVGGTIQGSCKQHLLLNTRIYACQGLQQVIHTVDCGTSDTSA